MLIFILAFWVILIFIIMGFYVIRSVMNDINLHFDNEEEDDIEYFI